MDLQAIPRVAIGAAKHGEVPVWVIPIQGKTPEDVSAALAQAQLSMPNGQAAGDAYRVDFAKDTPPEQLVAFAQQAIMALGVQPGQGWHWVSRDSDQLPG